MPRRVINRQHSAGPIRTYRAYTAATSFASRLRSVARAAAVRALTMRPGPSRPINCIRFPYYHHVFDDERAGFVAQVKYLKNLGDLLPIADAVEYLRQPSPPAGRYFCLTFDDGYKNCVTNAVPVLLDQGARAAFFVPTLSINAGVEVHVQQANAAGGSYPVVELLDWRDGRRMVRAGMTIGSHAASHRRLKDLSVADVERELTTSRATIERELGVPCVDVSSPWGQPGVDFTRDREPLIAERLGYRSFLTTERGRNADQPTPLCIPRDHVLAIWGTYQLKYFFSR
jgi:peptidoglycan/xylan/chitin deacetylase (PgdA/CDA1 family)